MRTLLLALVLLPFSAWAQYAGPGVETCRAFAEREQKQDGTAVAKVVFDRDQNLGIDRVTRKAGSQPVSSLLYGNGAIVYPKGLAIEISFACLLADEKRAVFFHWTPRENASALSQCSRNVPTGGNAAQCLESLLQVVEQDLTAAYAQRFQEARDADAKAGNEKAIATFRRSNESWIAYRDAECTRRSGAPEARKACVIDLSRRRLLDVR